MKVRTMLIVGAMALVAGCAADSVSTTEELTLEQAPLAVRRGIERAYPDGKVREIEKETYKESGAVLYEVKMVTAKGQKVQFEVAEDGEVLRKD